ncbi:MAG: isoleucine--tRNA ligase, partial [Campylobacterales bacterium]|nr:isoleucine--tRNA ligase [Campylobacterales bacterium]
LNKTLKDIIVKNSFFKGKSVRFTPGWDCHGLPIEQEIEKALGKEKKDALKKEEVRGLCREHAKKFIGIQMEEFKKMGVQADYAKPYVTMDFKFEANIYKALCEVAKKGLLVERSKPVYWSWAAKTALAEAEVEYKDKEDYSIFVAFALGKEALTAIGEDKASIVIWTTTPWTLPANVGISLNPDEEYALTTDGYIVAASLVEKCKANGLFVGEVKKTFASKTLEKLDAINPLNGRASKIVLGAHVAVEDGTGCVHTAPGHGEDDYRVGLKYNLDVIMPVDEEGKYDQTIVTLGLLPNASEYVGMHIFKANDMIVEMLGSSALKVSKFVHSYPHCWRTHKPVIYRATKQWFIAMDEKITGKDKTLREIALSEIEKINFYPATGRNRLKSMIENRPDWCISRQRDWGVPIAFLRHKDSGEVLMDERVLDIAIGLFEEEGADAWYTREVVDFLPYSMKTKADEYEKVNDILDVWFDSGSTFFSVLTSGNYDAGEYPADVYLEGSDQHRGWFQSSLLLSCAINERAPYKNVVTHGFTVDASGKKMSKSLGNVIAPEAILKEYGSEIMRLWVAMSDFTDDIKISTEILKQISEQYRKLRNSFRFLLANISDMSEFAPLDTLGELDRWILSEAKAVFAEVEKEFDAYEYARGMIRLNAFVVSSLSNIYMDVCKDRLYCDRVDAKERRASQTTMALILRSLLTLVAPILTYTADEVVEFMPEFLREGKSTIFEFTRFELPSVASDIDAVKLLNVRNGFFELVDELKKEGKLKSTLELNLIGAKELNILKSDKDLQDYFLVSGTADGEVIGGFEVEGVKFSVSKSKLHKCPRCWKFVSPSENEPCNRCAGALS